MADRCSDTTTPTLRTACLAVGLAAAVLGLGGPARADSIRVTPRAALDRRYGLEIVIDGRTGGPTSDAYVAVGPEKGFSNETAVLAAFTIDASRLSLGQAPASTGVLPFLRFGETPRPGPARVVVFLERTPSEGWLVGARTWDDASGTLVLAGRAPLPRGASRARLIPVTAPRGSRSPRLELEWAASAQAGAAAGRLRMLHVRPDGERVVLFERTDLNNGSQVVNHVRVGVVASDQGAGAAGRLSLDDFEVDRLSPPLP